ncbi:hypothetical protein L218DRAFT_982958 [Marasmius fiardii PR-910]|nr:hypothetical protein L218DRAFT_982958 [Marasmius fiardii PR-910]
MFFFQVLLFACYISQVVSNVVNRTIIFGDSSLDFSAGWLASHEQLSGGLFFTFSNVEAGGVQVALKGTLPDNTQRFEYIGLKRTGGSQYGICLNCGDDDSSILAVDGHDGTLESDDRSIPAIIFSLEVEHGRQNTFILFNLPDDRFGGQSSITFQSLVLTIDDGIDDGPNSSSSSSEIQTSSSTTLTSATSIRPSSPSQTSTTGSTSSPSSSPATVSVPANGSTRGSIIAVIVVFTVLPVVSLAIGLYFFMRHRARRKSRMSDFFMYDPNPVRRGFPSSRTSR